MHWLFIQRRFSLLRLLYYISLVNYLIHKIKELLKTDLFLTIGLVYNVFHDHILELFLRNALYFPFQKGRYLGEGNCSIFIAIENVKCLSQLLFKPFLLVSNGIGNKLAILQCATAIDIKFFESFLSNNTAQL